MTSCWLQAQLQLTLVINVLTLKTVDISSRFSPSVSSHLPVSEV